MKKNIARTIVIVIISFIIMIPLHAQRNEKRQVISVFEQSDDKCNKAMQESKNLFWLSDSATIIANELGWAKVFLTDSMSIKILDAPKGDMMPPVYRSDDGKSYFTEFYPCWDFDTPEYLYSSVVAEHLLLDSALVKAKIQGVDDIFIRSGQQIKYEEGYTNYTIAYTDNYIDYIRSAQFSCVCILKAKKKYIVNSTIRIPNIKFHVFKTDTLIQTLSDEALNDLFKKYFTEDETKELEKGNTEQNQ